MPRVLQQRVAQAAAQLAEAAPMVLILAFDHNGSTMIPLEAAAKNEDFGVELVPVPWGKNREHHDVEMFVNSCLMLLRNET